MRTWVENRVARPPHPRAYLANVIVPHELARLPPHLRARFVDAVYTFKDGGYERLLRGLQGHAPRSS